MATGRGSLEGGNGEVEMGRGATGTERKWQWGVGQRGGARWRAMGGGGEMGRRQWGGGKGKEVGWGGGEEGGRRKKEDSQIDMMGCLGGHRL